MRGYRKHSRQILLMHQQQTEAMTGLLSQLFAALVSRPPVSEPSAVPAAPTTSTLPETGANSLDAVLKTSIEIALTITREAGKIYGEIKDRKAKRYVSQGR